MSTGMTSRAAYRPRALSPDVQAKIGIAKAHQARRQKIERVRTALANIVDALERDEEMRRRSSPGGAAPSRLLAEALCAATDFEILLEDLK